jgi:hypothetical protein
MNIEGAELDVIKGMEHTIKITNSIAISCHDFLFESKSTKIKDAVKDFLIQNGFYVEERNSGKEVLDSWVYGKK